MAHPIRVLIAKPGLDGHDRGALVVAKGLRDEGMEVIYSGLRQTPAQIVATAIQEDVAVIGLSSLSGAHMELFPEVVRILREEKADDILVIAGGVIPDEDIPVLLEAGIKAVFTPGSTISEMATFIRANVDGHGAKQASPPLDAKAIDHVGIAVSNIDAVLHHYTDMLGFQLIEREIVESQGVEVALIEGNSVRIELLQPRTEESSVSKFLQKRGPGLHHLAYRVGDIHAAIKTLKAAGYRMIDEEPKTGAHGNLIAFIHPKDTEGVLTEVCQHVGKGETRETR